MISKTRLSIITTAGAALLLGAVSAQAGGDPEAGRKKIEALDAGAKCFTCHGEDGKGTSPTFPNLAGQYADYMVHALKSYKDGRRENAIMAPIASKLSLDDMEDIAAYYASQPALVHVPQTD